MFAAIHLLTALWTCWVVFAAAGAGAPRPAAARGRETPV